MAIVAPASKYARNTGIIIALVVIGFGLYCIYDGYYNQEFIEKHTKEGVPDGTLSFNRKAPPFLIGAGIIYGIITFVASKKKVVAEENELIIDDKLKIPYDAVQSIDKTHFEKKGYFIFTYKEDNSEKQYKISDRKYDNVNAVLDHLVSKLS